jgi:predicted PurR-regulated permease PerM
VPRYRACCLWHYALRHAAKTVPRYEECVIQKSVVHLLENRCKAAIKLEKFPMVQKVIGKIPSEFRLGLFFPLIFLNGWLLLILIEQVEPLVTIVVVAALFTFLLDYPINLLERIGVKRVIAVIVVLLITLVGITALASTLLPVIVQQANDLLSNLPTLIALVKKQLEALNTWIDARQLPINLDGLIAQLSQQLARQIQSIANQTINVAFETLGSIANIFLVLVFTIVLTLSGDQVWNGLLSWLPVWWKEQVQRSLRQTFNNFISGQFIIATVLTVLQTTALFVMNVPFGLLFGVGIGIMSLVPLGGATSITLLGLIMTLQNFWLGIKVLIVTILIGQINETVIAPRILGNLVGLNPFWLLISLFLGARFAGPLGLFLSVPIASFIKILGDAIKNPDIQKPSLDISEKIIVKTDISDTSNITFENTP